MKTALILGITGQTGSYLADLLLNKGYYRVYGLVRRTSLPSTSRLAHCLSRVELLQGDITDMASLQRALIASHPQEVYNFAAQSHVGESFVAPLATADATGLGALNLFEAIRLYTPVSAHVRTYQASSSEMFGRAATQPQTEATPLQPVSPYGCAKAFAHFCAQVYRQAYGMYIACGISYNHESERRGEAFVTRKITQAVARIKAGQQDILRLGNLQARRDWMHAKDVAWGAWLALQAPQADDYIFASGESHSVQEFADMAFHSVGLNSSDHILADPDHFRPLDIPELRGDARKAQEVLGWQVRVSFPDLVARMVAYDCAQTVPEPGGAGEAHGRPDAPASAGEPPATDVPGLRTPAVHGGE